MSTRARWGKEEVPAARARRKGIPAEAERRFPRIPLGTAANTAVTVTVSWSTIGANSPIRMRSFCDSAPACCRFFVLCQKFLNRRTDHEEL